VGDLQAAFERGWDSDDVHAEALVIIGCLSATAEDPDEFEVLCHYPSPGLDLLVDTGYVDFELLETRRLFRARKSAIVTATTLGVKARHHLVGLRRLSTVQRRHVCLSIVLEGIYRYGSVRVSGPTLFKPWEGLDGRDWCSYAGQWLDPRDDVAPALTSLYDFGLVARSGDLDPYAFYTPTLEGIRCVEDFGGVVNSWRRTQTGRDNGGGEVSPAPAATVSTVINGPVQNLHTGSGNLIVGLEADAILRLAGQIRACLPSLEFTSPERRDQAVEAVDALEGERDRGRVTRITQTLRKLISQAEGPLQDIAFRLLDAEIRRLGGLPPA
jgi:hypothetical protein